MPRFEDGSQAAIEGVFTSNQSALSAASFSSLFWENARCTPARHHLRRRSRTQRLQGAERIPAGHHGHQRTPGRYRNLSPHPLAASASHDALADAFAAALAWWLSPHLTS